MQLPAPEYPKQGFDKEDGGRPQVVEPTEAYPAQGRKNRVQHGFAGRLEWRFL